MKRGWIERFACVRCNLAFACCTHQQASFRQLGSFGLGVGAPLWPAQVENPVLVDIVALRSCGLRFFAGLLAVQWPSLAVWMFTPLTEGSGLL